MFNNYYHPKISNYNRIRIKIRYGLAHLSTVRRPQRLQYPLSSDRSIFRTKQILKRWRKECIEEEFLVTAFLYLNLLKILITSYLNMWKLLITSVKNTNNITSTDISTDIHYLFFKISTHRLFLWTEITLILSNRSLYTVVLRSPFDIRSLSTVMRCIEIALCALKQLFPGNMSHLKI